MKQDINATDKFSVGDRVFPESNTAFWPKKHVYRITSIDKVNNRVNVNQNGGAEACYSLFTIAFRIVPEPKKQPMKSPSISFIVANDGTINAFVGGKSYTLPKSSMFYEAAKAALKKKDAAQFVAQCDLEQSVRTRSAGRVTLVDGVILYNGNPLHNALTKRIYDLIAQDFPFDPLINFLENTLKNPERRAIDELYLFLEANTLPLTEDGHFLAFRRVDKNYLSLHANTDGTKNSNKVGETVSMARALVDSNRDQTCSKGLHFASLSYIPHYGSDSNGDRTMVVKINPKNVVSIPSDYSNQKGRCCEYEVVDEHLDGENVDSLNKSAVYKITNIGAHPSKMSFHTPRDPKTGRFVTAR